MFKQDSRYVTRGVNSEIDMSNFEKQVSLRMIPGHEKIYILKY